MLLAIDIGNTNSTIGVFDADCLISNWRTETKKKGTADEYALLLKDFFSLTNLSFEDINGIIVSNVVPSIAHAISSMADRYFNLKALCVTHENAGLKIKYPTPDEIGADRLVNGIAAYEKAKGPVIVVDFGTATTLDYIDEEGAYCGGTIAPGLAISNEALYHWTSKLPRVDIKKTDRLVAKSTVEAIQAGVFHGYQGLVKNLIEKMKKEVGGNPSVIATGGLASLIVKDFDVLIEKNLTLDGLRLIYSKSRNLQ